MENNFSEEHVLSTVASTEENQAQPEKNEVEFEGTSQEEETEGGLEEETDEAEETESETEAD